MSRALKSLEALGSLVIARVLVPALPFRIVAAHLGAEGRESPHDITGDEAALAREIGARLRAVCRRTGWKPKCLVRSTAAMVLLRRHGLEGTLYLGVDQKRGERLLAHAWVRCGNVYVTGGASRNAFNVLARFANANDQSRRTGRVND